MEFTSIRDIEKATSLNRMELFRLGSALLFIVAIMLFINTRVAVGPNGILLVVAGMIGGYMALNIGANDVANNVGPAVGSKAITLVGAIAIAAFFEAGGALIAGGDVVSTIKKGIIDPSVIPDSNTFIWLMIAAALLAAAIWLNIATVLGAPVSTTHSIVGGVLGAGIAAGGWAIANWAKVGAIAASWVISPVLGGLIAALFLYFIKRFIVYEVDKVSAAKRYVPYLVAVMAWAFSTYIVLKGIKKLWKFDFISASLIGLAVAICVFLLVRPVIARAASNLENTRESINELVRHSADICRRAPVICPWRERRCQRSRAAGRYQRRHLERSGCPESFHPPLGDAGWCHRNFAGAGALRAEN